MVRTRVVNSGRAINRWLHQTSVISSNGPRKEEYGKWRGYGSMGYCIQRKLVFVFQMKVWLNGRKRELFFLPHQPLPFPPIPPPPSIWLLPLSSLSVCTIAYQTANSWWYARHREYPYSPLPPLPLSDHLPPLFSIHSDLSPPLPYLPFPHSGIVLLSRLFLLITRFYPFSLGWLMFPFLVPVLVPLQDLIIAHWLCGIFFE